MRSNVTIKVKRRYIAHVQENSCRRFRLQETYRSRILVGPEKILISADIPYLESVEMNW